MVQEQQFNNVLGFRFCGIFSHVDHLSKECELNKEGFISTNLAASFNNNLKYREPNYNLKSVEMMGQYMHNCEHSWWSQMMLDSVSSKRLEFVCSLNITYPLATTTKLEEDGNKTKANGILQPSDSYYETNYEIVFVYLIAIIGCIFFAICTVFCYACFRIHQERRGGRRINNRL